MPTQVRYPGDWTGTEKLKSSNVKFYNLNYEFWDLIFSNRILEFIDKPSISQKVFLESIQKARNSLMSLKELDSYSSVDEYSKKIVEIGKYLDLISKSQGEFNMNLIRGIKLKENVYKSSLDLLNAVERSTTLDEIITKAMKPIDGNIDLVLVDITSENELLTALMAIKDLRKKNVDIHISLVRHEHENFSAKAILENFEKGNAFSNYFDSIIENSAQIDSCVISLLDGLGKGDTVNGLLKSDSGDYEEETSKAIKFVAVDAFVPELTLNMRLSHNSCHWGQCDFCAQVNGRSNREDVSHNLSRIIKRISRLMDYGYKRIIFSDEAIKSKDIVELSQLIIDEGLNFTWNYRSRIDFGLTEENIQLLQRAGCEEITFGLESASTKVLEAMNKYKDIPDKQDVGAYLRSIYDEGINIHLNLIVGFPTETYEQLQETTDFLIDYFDGEDGITISMNRCQLFRYSKMFREYEEYSIKPLVEDGDLVYYYDYENSRSRYRVGELEASIEKQYRRVVRSFNLEGLLGSIFTQTSLMFIFNGTHGLILRRLKGALSV